MRPEAGDAQIEGERVAHRLDGPRSASLEVLRDLLEAERARWFYWVPVFVGCGALIYFQLATEPSGWIVASAVVAALAIFLVGSRGTFSQIATAVLVCVGIGLAAAKARTQIVGAPVLQPQTGAVWVEGFIETLEAKANGGERITLLPVRVGTVDLDALPKRVRVSFRKATAGLLPGDYVGVEAKLSAPGRPSVPGGYDFSRYAFFRGIGAVGYATLPPELKPALVEPPFLMRASNAIARLRKQIGDRVVASLPGQTGAIANALITGDRSAIAEETNEAYRASGLFHILSISGLHMAIMGGAVFFALRFVFALFPGVALNYPIKKWAAVGAILGSLGYLTISGGSFATVRSFLMILVFFISILADRPAIALRNVALSALLILLVFPESVVDPGFQMSFAAVVGLVATYEALAARSERWFETAGSWIWRGVGFFAAIVGSTLVASAAVAPLGIYHFHQAQLYSVLANLVAVPICNLIVMPAALATLVLMPVGLETWPLMVMGPGLEAMAWVAYQVAGLKGSVSHVAAIPPLALGLMIAGGLWLCLNRYRWRLLGIVAIAVGVLVAPLQVRPDLLVGDEARLVVLRDNEGKFAGLASRYSEYELSQWLARDGDPREAGEIGIGDALVCDGVGCVGRVGELTVAVSKSPASLRDDCRRADIVILARDLVAGCVGPRLVVDRKSSVRDGTLAIYVGDDGGLKIRSVADQQGNRPWSQAAGR
ncbi:MAG: ComEC family competence protein [Alphaproteobacteria bacterium]|nr:ComEC family competence protein [Alphaproteobacteria bacterium]